MIIFLDPFIFTLVTLNGIKVKSELYVRFLIPIKKQENIF